MNEEVMVYVGLDDWWNEKLAEVREEWASENEEWLDHLDEDEQDEAWFSSETNQQFIDFLIQNGRNVK